MDLELQGKRALVTGGSRGIGKAVARGLAREGAAVAILARDAAMLATTAGELANETGATVVAVVADTTDDAAVERAVAEAAAALGGGIDILVNAAAEPGGYAPPPKLAEIDAAQLQREIDVKVMGYLRCARAVAPFMQAQRWGRIVNVSGLAARQTGSTLGSIRNVAVSALTKNLADELGPQGINVTVVHPGATVTERTPPAHFAESVSIGRLVTAAEVADVIAFLASPRSVAINGDAIAVGGGVRGAIHY